MADGSAIEWTDATWNPVTGCTVVSPGCTNCYAMRLAGTRLQHLPSRAGLTRETRAGPVWTGEVRLNEDWLSLPLRWRRPRLIFVCAHGDLFHESVPDAWIDRVFAVMALAPQHVFQVLTKRSTRMRAYVSRWFERLAAGEVRVDHPTGPTRFADLVDWSVLPRVLPNAWLGVSAEDQRRADERIPDLLATPAAVRWVSAEPLLGRIGFHDYLVRVANGFSPPIDWIVVGGESGPGARPMHPQWARDIRDQCAAAGVAFHFKQWGGVGTRGPAGRGRSRRRHAARHRPAGSSIRRARWPLPARRYPHAQCRQGPRRSAARRDRAQRDAGRTNPGRDREGRRGVSDRPIIFSAPMVRALLRGRKTMTRRTLKPQPAEDLGLALAERPIRFRAGDRLWVRETWRPVRSGDPSRGVLYRADIYGADQTKWRSPLFMPRRASRITLDVIDARVERLREIGERDAMAEGFGWSDAGPDGDVLTGDPRGAFARFWETLHGTESWRSDPWVAALTFAVKARNIDAVPRSASGLAA